VTGAVISGHAIEARLYAENPAEDYRPGSGTLHRFRIPALPGVRVDTGVRDGSVIGTHYDPMLAKVIAHGATRTQAARRLARALSEAQLHGLVTNRDLLVAILREPEFLAGHTDTGYLTRHGPASLIGQPSELSRDVHTLAAALAAQADRRATAVVQPAVPSGWRNVVSAPQQVQYRCGEQDVSLAYRITRDGLWAEVDGRALSGLILRSATPDEVDLEIDGVRRRIQVHRAGDTAYCDSVLGSAVVQELPRLPEPGLEAAPGTLFAPMPGTVVRVAVEVGEKIAAGGVVVVFEAMKMEHSVRAPVDGVVSEVLVAVGTTVDSGEVVAVITEEDAE
jgi:acetyl/propionyl-CoA carboxylase alpha subunit